MNIVLFGFMGTGKSTVGTLLARRLGWTFFDTDAMIEDETGFKVADIFAAKGEEAFRDLETKAVRLVALMDRAVISTGGGAPLRDENVRELKKNGAVTVCLTAEPETILNRLKDDAGARPLLKGGDPRESIRRLLADRQKAYARALHQVATDGLTPEQVAEKVVSFLPVDAA